VVESLTLSDLTELTSWSSPWAGHKAVVIGLGQVGFAVADTAHELGVDVLVVAKDADADVLTIVDVLGVSHRVGEPSQVLAQAALDHDPSFVVVSPGVAVDDPVVATLTKAGIPVWSEVDFAWRVRDKNDPVAPWVLVKGPEVADLATRILQAEGRGAHRVGFEAAPLLDALRDPNPYETLIIGVNPSAVDLWERYPLAPRRPLMTVSMDAEETGESGVFFDGTTRACVYRKGPGAAEARVQDADVVEGARAIGVGLDSPGMSELGLVEGILCDRAFLEDRQNQALEVSTIEELEEAGWAIPDDLPVILGAVAIARALDVPPAVIAGVLTLP